MIDKLLERNRAWAAEREASDPGYFKRLSDQQSPEYLWIGCSDSRVPANVITGLDPGEVFVHRNIANVVHGSDINCLSVLQFAVEVLKVRHVIVCGHYGCGGVRAALEGATGLLDYWLHPVRRLARERRDLLDRIADAEGRIDKLCELNVALQVEMLARTPLLEEAWGRGQEIRIHGWCYGLKDGLIRDLACGRSGPRD
ncbi:carbonic anhydrase [Tistlia consotensis]|uniref:Carbonic anhydrase n=1 Tax=Tistlia consotensis USBA 355 TaxID=560819 RepID=A0A1Y6CKN8_9PROT|nr:carbonic anhydrase [Tistlia consotensis]SMF57130.1 carbonic anhydrase [Tistlia consotensis USBA 355]SNR45424.1 carbonic anhydrase [Tistlia consotensis]